MKILYLLIILSVFSSLISMEKENSIAQIINDTQMTYATPFPLPSELNTKIFSEIILERLNNSHKYKHLRKLKNLITILMTTSKSTKLCLDNLALSIKRRFNNDYFLNLKEDYKLALLLLNLDNPELIYNYGNLINLYIKGFNNFDIINSSKDYFDILCLAAKYNNLNIAKILIKNGFELDQHIIKKLNFSFIKKFEPLCAYNHIELAIFFNNMEMVKLLIKKTLNKDLLKNLNISCFLYPNEFTEFIEQNYNKIIADQNQNNNLQTFYKRICWRFIYQLESFNLTTLRKQIYPKQFEKRSPILKLLLENGYNVNSCTKDKKSLFMETCQWGSKENVMFLLENGGDINIKDFNGKTAYDYASHENKLLLQSFYGSCSLI